ncbi:hypothetical protein [Silvibacterium acidisoli]|uniref:hypothetical protein n=1 Tax=Acidobacteriaceae bacterium ZG23-2 TaxID=2883246 RepID=UPI00406D3643
MRDTHDQEVVPFTRKSFLGFVVMIVLLTAPLWLPRLWRLVHHSQTHIRQSSADVK